MSFSRRWLAPLGWYAAVAVALTWPAAIHPISAIPGAPRTDLADAMWSLWFTAQCAVEGRLPSTVEGYLNFPDGGAFWPADPVDGLLGLPLVLTLGPAVAWTALALGHLVFAGVAAHRLGEAWRGNGYVAGTLYAAAPITLAHLQNGASEAVGGTGWLALAALALTRLEQRPSLRGVVGSAAALGIAAVSHAYTGVLAYVFLTAIVLLAASWRARGFLVAAGLAGALLAAGPAALAIGQSTAKDNVVGIKGDKELSAIRRTIGAADPEVYVHPGDFRSPNFHELSRYGEELVHCAYLGWVPLLAAAVSLRRRRGSAVLWLATITALLLALGPVLVENGGPVILAGRRAIPLPYLLVEKLPGFRSLSLVWRLAQLGALGLAVLSSRAPGRAPLLAGLITAAALAETRFASPARALPAHTDGTIAPEIVALAAEPEGAVMNYPVVGGRAYLYEQTAHHKPVTGTLNFPNNNTSRKVWKVAIDKAGAPKAEFAAAVVAEAKAEGIRYLVVHVDARAHDDDMHTDAVRAIKDAFTPIAQSTAVRVYRFW